MTLGVDRSIDKAYRATTGRETRSSGRWNSWAQRYNWANRAAEWDRFVLAEAQSKAAEVVIHDLAKVASDNMTALIALRTVGVGILGRADIRSIDAAEARRLLVQASSMIVAATDGLRDETGTPERPQLHGHIVRNANDLSDDDLLAIVHPSNNGSGSGSNGASPESG
tara:strand:+ start:1653 stop:2156 length:504 start_codon:yes stop_codon:yes gene_type:complete